MPSNSPLSAGTPDAPRCGFSRKVAAALQATEHPFGFFDILSDEAVRQVRKHLPCFESAHPHCSTVMSHLR